MADGHRPAWFATTAQDAACADTDPVPRTHPAASAVLAAQAAHAAQAAQDLATVRAYHRRSTHQLQRYAAGPDTLDWDAQPDPWRRYAGARLWPLPFDTDDLATPWPALHRPGGQACAPAPFTRRRLGQWLALGLGLAAWKTLGPDRWAVRCTPSSGNLHPTEAHLLLQGCAGLPDGLYHYAPHAHALEQRALLAPAQGAVAPRPGLWLGLSSIHWREAWKYGERAFRYSQLDLGHAVGALRYAAAVLGWGLALDAATGADGLDTLLGLARAQDFAGGAERESPERLLVVDLAPHPSPTASGWQAAPAPEPLPDAQRLHAWAGQANRLDPRPMYRWPLVDEVDRATRPPSVARAPTAGAAGHPAAPARPEGHAAVPDASHAQLPAGPRAEALIRQRRSAQRMDRGAALPMAVLQRWLAALQPSVGLPWDAWPWAPRVHVVVFAHRVQGLAPGAYLWPRHGRPADTAPLADLAPHWPLLAQRATPVPALPGLWCLAQNPALAGTLRTLCCHQALGADANAVLALVAEFDRTLDDDGAAGYRRLLQEAGLLGHVLYLQAEAEGRRGTGIGCFFDDAVHELLGLAGTALQSLYHFALGTPVADTRIASAPPYGHLDPDRPDRPDGPDGPEAPLPPPVPHTLPTPPTP